MPRSRLLLALGCASVAFAAAGCGAGKMTAAEVEQAQRQLNPSAFADIRCVERHESGWDYVCTYSSPDGRRKLGVVVGSHHLLLGSGTVLAGQALPDGPHMHAASLVEYRRRAGAVCATRAASVRALGTPKTRAELLDFGERIVSLEELEQSRLAGITPPADERDAVGAFMRSIDRVQRAIETFRDAVSRRDAADLLQARRELASARRASNAAARRLGLSCRH